MDSHERPQDPRCTGSAAQTRARYHGTPYSMYGMTVNGHVLGSPWGHYEIPQSNSESLVLSPINADSRTFPYADST